MGEHLIIISLDIATPAHASQLKSDVSDEGNVQTLEPGIKRH